MAIGESAGLLFKIKADASQADRELSDITRKIGGTGEGLAGLAGPAGIAAGVLTAVGTSAVAAGTALFNLTKAAADYGSAVFDASQRTGLGAEAISALKYAADTSGSSLEAIAGSVAKFSVLMGDAANGNEKAADTLKQYSITAKDLEGGLAQAIRAITDETDATKQAAAAKALFKDRTGEILPVLKSFDGNLPGLISKLKDLGIVMSDEDARAADEFGDTLDTLNAQADALGRQFATELMPLMVSAMNAISQAMADNKGVAQEWGKALVDTISGVQATASAARSVFNIMFQSLTLGFGNTAQQAQAWSVAMRAAIGVVTAGISELLINLNAVGAGTGNLTGQMGGSVNIPTTTSAPRISGGGGGGRARGGGGGRSGESAASIAEREAREAEERRRKEVQAVEDTVKNLLEIYSAGYKERIAILDNSLALGLIKEKEHIEKVARVRQEAIQDEITANQGLLNNSTIRLNAEERAEIEQKLVVLAIELRTEKLKGATQITEQTKKETEAEEKLLQKEKERLQVIKERRQLKDLENSKKDLAAKVEARNVSRNQDEDVLGRSVLTDFSNIDGMDVRVTDLTNAFQELGSIAGAAVNGLAQGIGNMVQNMVLMGSAGPNAMKKLVASVLAGVAAQAAVLAIMELAYGIAALTPWGAAIYGPAAPHFKAAALFGAVAVGTGLAGRAIAGDSFKQQSGAATGRSGGAGGDSSIADSKDPRNNFTTNAGNPFNRDDKGNPMRLFGDAINKLTLVTAQAEETNNKLATKLQSMSPGHVVAMGASDAADEIARANAQSYGNDIRNVDTTKRNLFG